MLCVNLFPRVYNNTEVNSLKLIRLKGQLLLLNHGLTHNFLRNLDYDPKFSNAAIQFFKNNKSELIQPLLFVIMMS